MANTPSTNALTILKSDWGNLSEVLLAKFYPIKRSDDGKTWVQDMGTRQPSSSDPFTLNNAFEVWAPATEGTQEMSLNWNSPFEGAGSESKAPTLSAMLQSGSISANVQGFLTSNGGAAGQSAAKVVQDAMGRTGITKLNSTQTFGGMPPVKMSMTLHFRAVTDAYQEVEVPVLQLERWALPQYLADDGVIAGALKNGISGLSVETIFPSLAPQILGFRLGSRDYHPMVIESMSKPLTGPKDANGVSISVSIQITLASLQAWDTRDLPYSAPPFSP